MMMCAVTLGDIYPVTESIYDASTLFGKDCDENSPCRRGGVFSRHDSHYAAVKHRDKSFHPVQLREEPDCDEFVVFDAAQVLR
jgi:hypothetical protein